MKVLRSNTAWLSFILARDLLQYSRRRFQARRQQPMMRFLCSLPFCGISPDYRSLACLAEKVIAGLEMAIAEEAAIGAQRARMG